MAMAYASSSVMLMLPSPKPYCACLNKTPVLRFPVAASSSKPSTRTNGTFQIPCQDKDVVVPLDQRWMFDEEEAKGPVLVQLPHKICKTASKIPCPHQRATPLPTKVYAPPHWSACTFSSRCPAPPTGVRRKVCHFASCRGSISPPLYAQLKRSLPLIKSRAKETRSASSRPSLYNFSKSTWSPSTELLSRHPALVAPFVSGQTFVHIPKYLPALFYHFRSSKYHYGFFKYPYACFAYLCATVAYLVHSSC
ncbi:ribosomal protein L13 family protein [Actinidia rufa]|uniref:Ribosomal protein L13 family protein n=1 Tax=Actinidia rufa TaxID=165716 RepID=A0A7J0DRA4_9ERIC|nr:ribosomal protein L13 family protein [Actinidia rufa]